MPLRRLKSPSVTTRLYYRGGAKAVTDAVTVRDRRESKSLLDGELALPLTVIEKSCDTSFERSEVSQLGTVHEAVRTDMEVAPKVVNGSPSRSELLTVEEVADRTELLRQ
jgi:hypothetical protein